MNLHKQNIPHGQLTCDNVVVVATNNEGTQWIPKVTLPMFDLEETDNVLWYAFKNIILRTPIPFLDAEYVPASDVFRFDLFKLKISVSVQCCITL